MMDLKVLQPARLGTLSLRNRIVYPPMVTRFADEGGMVTERLVAYAAERARGGVGLYTLEAAYIDPAGKGFFCGVGIDDDDKIAGLGKLTDAVHACGGLASVQLHHAGRETGRETTGLPVVAPSNCPVHYSLEPVHELSGSEIEALVLRFAEAAARARKAGFDAVELHGAHGYLLSQFLSPYTNKRGDVWGGDPERRLAFPLAVAKAVREAVGGDFTVTYRLSVEEAIPGGLTLQEGAAAASVLAKSGFLDALHLVAGNYDRPDVIIPPATEGYATNRARAAAVREAVGPGFPLVVAGRVKNVFVAEELIRDGMADFVAMGRALIADPELPALCAQGRFSSVRTCLGCNDGCAGQSEQGLATACSINPGLGFERDFPLRRKASVRRKILVAGAGPAGMEAAWTAARRGHRVLLCEKEGRVGGQFFLAGIPPHKDEIFVYLRNMLQRLRDAGVEVRLNCPVTPGLLQAEKPDHVLAATGGTPLVPPFAGLSETDWMSSTEALTTGLGRLGRRVAVIGGGLVGCETAEVIADSGRQVTVLEMMPECAAGLQATVRQRLLEHLETLHAVLLSGARVERFAGKHIVVRTEAGGRELGPFDSVVVALGSRPDEALAKELRERNIPHTVIGDAVRTGKVMAATASALRAAWEL